MGKRFRDYLFIFLSIVGIAGFLWPKSIGDFAQPKGNNTSSLVYDVKDSNSNSYPLEIPVNWDEIIDENNKIMAEVDVPDSIRERGFQKAAARIVGVDPQNILSLLEGYYHPQMTMEDEDVIQYTGADNMYLYFFKDALEGVSMTSSLNDYISMAYREGLTEDYNRDQYPLEKELDKFSIDDCDIRLSDFCDNFGIGDEIHIMHRTLDYKMLEAEAEELHPDGTKSKPDYQWTQKDSSYYCTISQTCNNVPIIPSYYITSYADILYAGGYTCLLNSERLISFYVKDVFDIQYDAGVENLIDFADIIEKYKQYIMLSMQDYETAVTDITLRVIAVDYGNGNYVMTPIWVFYGIWSDEREGTSGPHAIFINAVTGERL